MIDDAAKLILAEAHSIGSFRATCKGCDVDILWIRDNAAKTWGCKIYFNTLKLNTPFTYQNYPEYLIYTALDTCKDNYKKRYKYACLVFELLKRTQKQDTHEYQAEIGEIQFKMKLAVYRERRCSSFISEIAKKFTPTLTILDAYFKS